MMIDLSESVMAFVGRGWMFSVTPSAVPSDTVAAWIAHESITGFGTHQSGYTSTPIVIRNTDVHQAYQADIDE